MIAIEPAKQRRLVASLRLLESDREGEQLAALEASKRLLPSGVKLADLMERGLATIPSARATAPEPVDVRDCWAFRGTGPTWKQKAGECFVRLRYLSTKEAVFVRNLAYGHNEPTAKQRRWLDDIAARLGVV